MPCAIAAAWTRRRAANERAGVPALAYGYTHVEPILTGHFAPTDRDETVYVCYMSWRDAVDKIRYWVKERKFAGLRLYTAGGTHANQSNWMSDPNIFPGLECAQQLGLSVCVSLKPAGIPQLLVLIKRFPKVRFVIDHMMEPPIAEGLPYAGSEFLFDLAQYGNVHLKMTTLNIRASRKEKGSPETFFPLLGKKFGASPIAWGSNYPSDRSLIWRNSA